MEFKDDLSQLRSIVLNLDGGDYPRLDSREERDWRLMLALAERLEAIIEEQRLANETFNRMVLLIEQRLWNPIAVPVQPWPSMPVSVREDGTGTPPPGPPTTRTDEAL